MAQELIRTAVFFLGILAAAFLARHNWKRDRADRRGAFILAFLVFLTRMAAWLLRDDVHVLEWSAESEMFGRVVGEALYVSVQVFTMYVALEPLVRRRLPDALIAWNRLLAGRPRDPLVGHRVLVGVAVGVLGQVLNGLLILAPTFVGGAPLSPHRGGVPLLSGASYVLEFFLMRSSQALFAAVGILFLLVLFQLVFRRRSIATALCGLVIVGWGLSTWWAFDNLPLTLVFTGFQAALFLFTLQRFGLLALVVAIWIFSWLNYSPFSFAFSAWYAGQSALVLTILLSIAAFGFYTSLGGRPVFGTALLEE